MIDIQTLKIVPEKYFVIKVEECTNCKGSGNIILALKLNNDDMQYQDFYCNECNGNGEFTTTVSLRVALKELFSQ